MPGNNAILKLVSGGQTGVDRAALDVAIDLNLPHGGWCPRNRLAEDGRIPDAYQLQETESSEYAVRTECNVVDSDATLILFIDQLSGGTKLTRTLARRHRRPCLAIDLSQPPFAEVVRSWLVEHGIQTLNVAGPRESSAPGIAALARDYLMQVLADPD